MMFNVGEERRGEGRKEGGGNAANASVQYVFAWDTNNIAYGTDDSGM